MLFKTSFVVLVFGTILLCSSNAKAQDSLQYEIIKHPKVEQGFTVQDMDSLRQIFLSVRKDVDTVYYEVSPYVTFKIYPRGLVGTIKEE